MNYYTDYQLEKSLRIYKRFTLVLSILLIMTSISLIIALSIATRDKIIINENIIITESVSEDTDTVTATVYHAVPEQCDGDYLTTASGRKIESTNSAYNHRYIAVSRDLLKKYHYGDRVLVTGTGIYDGIYIVADTMNKRYEGYVDILINPGMKTGKWKNVIITKVP